MLKRTSTVPVFLAAACLGASFILGSCGKQRGCNSFGADNYDPDALIDDGSCIETRDKFLGTYTVDSDCFSNGFLRTISQTSERFVVEISSINDTLGSVLATVANQDLFIGQQTVRNGVTVEGAGVYDSELNELNLTIRIRDNRTGTTVIRNCMENCRKN